MDSELPIPQLGECQTDVNLAAELVDLGRTLARWKLNRSKICLDAAALSFVSVEAGAMSERVLWKYQCGE